MAPRSSKGHPTQTQLLFPLLETLDAHDGSATPRQAADALAERLGLDEATRTARVDAGAAGSVNQWDRTVRWVREQAKALGFITGPTRNLWALTAPVRDGLRTAQPGVVITVYETAQGMALYATCETAMRCVADGSVNLILTSPPYPLLRQKAYGNMSADAYVAWLLDLAAEWRTLLAPDGSLVLNLGPAWEDGQPTMSLYREEIYVGLVRRLGYHLASDAYWASPSKLPGPAEWVTVRRERVTPAVEHLYWFSQSPHPKADNRRVLVPYSDSMRRRITSGGERGHVRPSGHVLASGAFARDNGGAIPRNVLVEPHTASNTPYLRYCAAHGLPPHPARMPAPLAAFFIGLTTEPGDLVVDPFGGSNTVAAEAERLGRRWVTSERVLDYVVGGASHFLDAAGFVDHIGLPARPVDA